MNLTKQSLFSRLLVVAASALVVAITGSQLVAQTILTIDGRDVANLGSDGNHPTFHNPPVGFAFTFGGVNADNPDAGPGDPPTNTETSFLFQGNDFGGLGFGTAATGEGFAFGPASMHRFEMDLTVNSANTLPSLVLNLKDRDPTQFGTGQEEHQYTLTLPAPGTTTTLVANLGSPGFTNNAIDNMPNFDTGNLGLDEVQLQYPFNDGGTGAILDITITEMRIVKVPEPSTVLFAMACLATGVVCRRKRKFC